MLRKKILAVCVFCLTFLQIEASVPNSSCNAIVRYIHQHLPNYGKLERSPNGFFYLKVDDDYVHQCIGQISEEGFEAPPYFGELYTTGAHISIFYPEELTGKKPVLSEIGQTVYFHVKGCQIWTPPHWKEIEQVYVVLVEAPLLKSLREKYGFSQDFQFHITIGVKRKMAKSA